MLLEALPSFDPVLSRLLDDWPAESPGVCLELAEFGQYLAVLIANGNVDDATAGMGVIELLLQDGSPEVRDAASTCALESLDSHAAGFGLAPSGWGNLLPPLARGFLSDWHGEAGRYER